MAVNSRILLFVFLFLCLANALFSQADDAGQFRHRIAWPKDDYALRYEVVFEKEENGEYTVLSQEFTEEPFIFISLPPGDYRLRVIPYDFRDVPGKGTDWKNFKVIAVIDSGSESPPVTDDVPPSLAEQEKDTMLIENLTEGGFTVPEPAAGPAKAGTASKKRASPSKKHSGFFIAPFGEGIGYSRHGAAFGGGIAFGGSFSGKGIGLSLLYAQDAENFIFLEALAHMRLYLSRMKNNTGLFLQAEGGVVFFAYEKPEIADNFSPVGGLSAGWRFPLGKHWYIEPGIRGGYPYMYGAGLSAGIRFD